MLGVNVRCWRFPDLSFEQPWHGVLMPEMGAERNGRGRLSVHLSRELQPHQQRENPRQQEEQHGGADIEVADHRVVDGAEDAPLTSAPPRPLQLVQSPRGRGNVLG